MERPLWVLVLSTIFRDRRWIQWECTGGIEEERNAWIGRFFTTINEVVVVKEATIGAS